MALSMPYIFKLPLLTVRMAYKIKIFYSLFQNMFKPSVLKALHHTQDLFNFYPSEMPLYHLQATDSEYIWKYMFEHVIKYYEKQM